MEVRPAYGGFTPAFEAGAHQLLYVRLAPDHDSPPKLVR